MKQQQLYNSAPAAPWIHCQSRATHNVLISSTLPSFLLCDAMRWESRCGSITLPVAVLSRILRRSFFYKAKDSVAAYRRVVVWANRSKKKVLSHQLSWREKWDITNAAHCTERCTHMLPCRRSICFMPFFLLFQVWKRHTDTPISPFQNYWIIICRSLYCDRWNKRSYCLVCGIFYILFLYSPARAFVCCLYLCLRLFE